jgi:hypothetical protein
MFATYSSRLRKRVSAEGTLTETSALMPDSVAVLDNKVRIWMKVIVSLVVLAVTLFVVISKEYSPTDKHWAYSSIGLIVGTWLKF